MPHHADSLAVVRVDGWRNGDPDPVVETLTVVAGPGTRSFCFTVNVADERARRVGGCSPDSGQDMALPFTDGWIAVAYHDPYRVAWRRPDGGWVRGPELSVPPRSFSSPEEQCFAVRRYPFRGVERPCARDELVDRDWPSEVPPFLALGTRQMAGPGIPPLQATPEGRLMVRRTPAPGVNQNHYDVWNRQGELDATLSLPANEAVVGYRSTRIVDISDANSYGLRGRQISMSKRSNQIDGRGRLSPRTGLTEDHDMCDRRTMSQCRVQTFHASRFRPSAPLSFWVGAMSVALVVPPVHATGQDREVLEATTVMAESPEGYTRIVGVRELSDGRVLIVDQVERFVYLLSRDLSRESVIGSRGQGPGEYQQVSRIIPLEGDSSALGTDRGYLMVTPELDIEGRLPWERSFRVMDRLGYMYGMSPESQTRLALRREIRTPEMDSVTIVRWHRDGSPDGAELVGVVPQLVQPAVISQRIPFQPQPLYHVSPDGTLIIAHPEPFHLEMIRSDGGWQRGPEIAYQPVRVTEGHREAWREERRRPRVGLRVPIGRDQPGQAQVVTTTYRVDEPSEWPEELPPFLSDALSFDGDDRLWIRRTTEAGAPPRFDVFDREGRLAHEVRLPEGTRLVGFGDGVAYVVRKDQFDLEYLQRIQLP